MSKIKALSLAATLLGSTVLPPLMANPVDPAFNYQGRLQDAGRPAEGTYDLRFALFNAPVHGTQTGNAVTNQGVPVTNGLFSTRINFGSGPFDGTARWLEIAVRTNGGSESFTVLNPRQSMDPIPYALKALGISGPIDGNQLLPGTVSGSSIAAGSVTATSLAEGAVTTAALAENVITASKLATTSRWSALTIPNPFQGSRGFFGSTVAGFGSHGVLVGAPQNDSGGQNGAGEVYLFRHDGVRLVSFRNAVPTPNAGFGASIATVGPDFVLIGAPSADVGAPRAGAAYGFNALGALRMAFTNPTPASADAFGAPVAAFGPDRVLIAASWDDTAAPDAGVVYLFGTNGTLLQTLTSPAPAQPHFGFSLARAGDDLVLVGSPYHRKAYLFTTNGTLATTLHSPAPPGQDLFGWAVAAVGTDRVLIGAWGHDTEIEDVGAAYLFSTNGSLLTTITNPTPAFREHFGTSLAILGADRLLIGASREGIPATGKVYLYDTNGGLLATFENPSGIVDSFGTALAGVGEDQFLVGASAAGFGGLLDGAAYLFSRGEHAAGVVAESVRARAITTASLDDQAVTAAKIAIGQVVRSLNGLTDHVTLAAGANVSLASSGNELVLSATDPGAFSLNTTNAYYTGGRVGIGTTTPGRLLQLGDPGIQGSQGLMRLVSRSGTGAYVRTWELGVPEGGDGDGDGRNYSFVIDDTALGTTPEFVVRYASGNVGIGTMNPQARLHVNGPILSGPSNLLSGTHAAIGGGWFNSALGSASAVGGGQGNITSNEFSVVAGGLANVADGPGSAIGGGIGNRTLAFTVFGAAIKGYSVISGGQSNIIQGQFATIGGGVTNYATTGSTVGGGSGNTATGGGTVPGGANNLASGSHSFAAGNSARASHDGSFVWSDGTGVLQSDRNRAFYARASGGFDLYTGEGVGARLPAGSGSWSAFSDRHAKEHVRPVNCREVLEKVAALPLATWSYKAQSAAVRHLGPMAQDFHDAFGLGETNTHIATVDADGVALAAIQGLHELIVRQQARIAALEQQLAARDEAMAQWESRMADLFRRIAKVQNEPPARRAGHAAHAPEK